MAEIALLESAPLEGSKTMEAGGDMMIVEGSPAAASESSQSNAVDRGTGTNKSLKRKRAMAEGNVPLIADCRRELDELFEYYKEVTGYSLHLGEAGSSSINSVVACLLEERNLPFSKLVDEVHEKLKAIEGNQGITLASVRSTVLFIGQRMMYGLANADADVLEDESQSCLWCWETRDMKLLPASQRGVFNVRRVARKKIHERISALSATISALSTPENHETYKSDLLKASDKLGRALNGTAIRSVVEKLKQKNDADMAEKEAKLKEKESVKEFERNKRNAGKEQKRMERELQKEKLQTEKEIKRLQDEAAKEEKRREKEETELKKQLKKQQDESEREQRRREKEEAELKKQLKKQQDESEREQRRREKEEAEHKKQLALQKQATMMERFLKRRKDDNHFDNCDNESLPKAPQLNTSCKVEDVVNTTASLMDHTLSKHDFVVIENLLKSHIVGWHRSCHSNKSLRWGVRRNPKIEVIKELKLQGPSSETDPPGESSTPNRVPPCEKVKHSSEQNLAGKSVDGWEETVPADTSYDCTTYIAPACARLMVRKLLQFDKSHRPAYYGTWSKKSSVVGPQHPLEKDPDLDYDVDSDEEWEEEDPGESLSDCDKDDEEEHVEEGHLKSDDENESEDGFFVPDGYLSENEGVEADSILDDMDEKERSPPCVPEVENEEFRALLRQQKHLNSLTEQALRKSQTLVIFNLMHEKSASITAEGLTGSGKHEQICLQALCMRTCHEGATIDIAMDQNQPNERQEACHNVSKCSATPAVTTAVIADSDLLEVVGSIRACPHGINKVVESLQRKFPSISKTQLKNKVREISDFVDNRWLVKKEVLDRLGISPSPDERRRPKGIMTFFSKRCSSQPCPKLELLPGEDRQCSESNALI